MTTKLIKRDKKLIEKNKKSRMSLLLESTKLSNLPAPLKSKAAVANCANCGGKISGTDLFSVQHKICRECLVNYSRIEAALNAAADKRAREARLEKMRCALTAHDT